MASASAAAVAAATAKVHADALVKAGRALVADAIRSSAGKKNNGSVAKPTEEHEQALRAADVALIALRKVSRDALVAYKAAGSSVAEARSAIDEKEQSVRADAYESRNLESVIASCVASRDACTRELEALGELVHGPRTEERAAIEAKYAGMQDAAALVEHDVMAWRLGEEYRARVEALDLLGEKRRERAAVRRVIGWKKRWMLERDEEYKEFVAASRAIHKRMASNDFEHAADAADMANPQRKRARDGEKGEKGTATAWKAVVDSDQRELAKSLPEPLYVAFYQFVSAKETHGFDIDVGVLRTAQDQLSKGVSGADDCHLYEASETYFSLSLRDGKQLLMKVLFRYLPRLGIVVAETENVDQMMILVGLYSGDTGDDTPNWATLLKNGAFSYSADVIARPFRWAQRVAGMDIFSDRITGTDRAHTASADVDAGNGEDVSNEGADDTDLRQVFREGRAAQLVKDLFARYQSQKSLKDQIDELVACRLPAFKQPAALAAYRPRSTLVFFEETDAAGAARKAPPRGSPGAAHDEEGEVEEGEMELEPAAKPVSARAAREGEAVDEVDCATRSQGDEYRIDGGRNDSASRKHTRYFQALLRSNGIDFKVKLVLYADFPDRAVDFSLRAVRSKAATTSEALSCSLSAAPVDADTLALIEAEVNVHVAGDLPAEQLAAGDATSPLPVLGIQFHRLMQCVDICSHLCDASASSQAGKANAVFHTVDGRLRRGRDRRLPFIFDPVSGCIVHR